MKAPLLLLGLIRQKLEALWEQKPQPKNYEEKILNIHSELSSTEGCILSIIQLNALTLSKLAKASK